MSVVVSDTSPLHYLILCGAETTLPRLFSHVVIPPMVFRELQQPNTPATVRQWAGSLPSWAVVQTPKALRAPMRHFAVFVASLSLQERFELAAFLAELDEQSEAEFRHAVVERMKTMDEGKKVSQEEVEDMHYQRLANEIEP